MNHSCLGVISKSNALFLTRKHFKSVVKAKLRDCRGLIALMQGKELWSVFFKDWAEISWTYVRRGEYLEKWENKLLWREDFRHGPSPLHLPTPTTTNLVLLYTGFHAPQTHLPDSPRLPTAHPCSLASSSPWGRLSSWVPHVEWSPCSPWRPAPGTPPPRSPPRLPLNWILPGAFALTITATKLIIWLLSYTLSPQLSWKFLEGPHCPERCSHIRVAHNMLIDRMHNYCFVSVVWGWKGLLSCYWPLSGSSTGLSAGASTCDSPAWPWLLFDLS